MGGFAREECGARYRGRDGDTLQSEASHDSVCVSDQVLPTLCDDDARFILSTFRRLDEYTAKERRVLTRDRIPKQGTTGETHI